MLRAQPITLREANAFVSKHHRHAKPKRGCKFTIAAVNQDGVVVGVVIAARPDARELSPTKVLDVARNCTDGTRNACSFLYGRAVAIARLMGYERVITYKGEEEDGASLKAAGFRLDSSFNVEQWHRERRPRHKARTLFTMHAADEQEPTTERRERWVIVLTTESALKR